ncbi:kinase-like protein [Meredithblackwellia eburnea MCA 4105]
MVSGSEDNRRSIRKTLRDAGREMLHGNMSSMMNTIIHGDKDGPYIRLGEGEYAKFEYQNSKSCWYPPGTEGRVVKGRTVETHLKVVIKFCEAFSGVQTGSIWHKPREVYFYQLIAEHQKKQPNDAGGYHVAKLLAPLKKESVPTNYLVLERYETDLLFGLLELDMFRKPTEICKLIHQMLLAGEFIHHLGIVHRDIKHGNVFSGRLNQPEEVPDRHGFLLGDFGFALHLGKQFPSMNVEGVCAPPESIYNTKEYKMSMQKGDFLRLESAGKTEELEQYIRCFKLYDTWSICYVVLCCILFDQNQGNNPVWDALERHQSTGSHHPSTREEFMREVGNYIDTVERENLVGQHTEAIVKVLKMGLRDKLTGQNRRWTETELLGILREHNVSYALSKTSHEHRFVPQLRIGGSTFAPKVFDF